MKPIRWDYIEVVEKNWTQRKKGKKSLSHRDLGCSGQGSTLIKDRVYRYVAKMRVWFFPYVSLFSTGFRRRLKNIYVHNFLKLFRIILAFMFPTCVTHRIHMIFTWHSLRQCMLSHTDFKKLVIIFLFSFLKNWHFCEGTNLHLLQLKIRRAIIRFIFN